MVRLLVYDFDRFIAADLAQMLESTVTSFCAPTVYRFLIKEDPQLRPQRPAANCGELLNPEVYDQFLRPGVKIHEGFARAKPRR